MEFMDFYKLSRNNEDLVKQMIEKTMMNACEVTLINEVKV